ncbi:MAG TPA: hypothetical protein VGQ37_19120 [Vicinamibacterales bacterium]|jgi:hypothetical protein|nr:hypothetical protein [Vicinamibacterales bacterium]
MPNFLRVIAPVAAVALLTVACNSTPDATEAQPAISTSAADNLVPGQLARGAALQTEIRSAGHDCNKVVRTFQQGVRDGGDIWDAECEGGEEYGVVSRADGTTDVLECSALERQTGTSCWEKF